MSNDDGSRAESWETALPLAAWVVSGVCIRIDSGGMEGQRSRPPWWYCALTSNAVRPSYEVASHQLPSLERFLSFRRLTRRDVSSFALPSQARGLGLNGRHA